MYWRLSITPVTCLCSVARTDNVFGSFRRQLRSSSSAVVAYTLPITSVFPQSTYHTTSKFSHVHRCSRRWQHACVWTRDLAYRVQSETSALRQICHSAALFDATTQKQQQEQQQQPKPKQVQHRQLTMDYTATVVSILELKAQWIPAKIEQVTTAR